MQRGPFPAPNKGQCEPTLVYSYITWVFVCKNMAVSVFICWHVPGLFYSLILGLFYSLILGYS